MSETGPKIPRDALEKGNFRIRNMLAKMERTFLPVGSQIGKYRVIEEIDKGGMAVVYKATQLDLDRQVALKVMPANISLNPRFVERFLSEAHAIAKLSHPNIVSIYEVAMENNIYYLAMEYIPGKNLYYYLHYSKPKLIDVLEIISRLADALSYAHSQKIIHRDLKLNNVIMKDMLTPVLIDFGLAKAMENEGTEGITRTGEIMGSPSYMAPERLLGGTVDQRSDVCSLGIMLYEMLTFKNPYLDQRNLHQTTINVMEANPIPPRKLVPWLPPEIEAITLKAMAKDASIRYQTMEELKADINRYQKGDVVLARPPSIWSKIKRFTKRNWAQISIAGLIVLFSTLFGAYYVNQLNKERSHWQIIYNENFGSDTEKNQNWFTSSDSLSDSVVTFRNGTLSMKSSAVAYARLQRRFNRDVLVEFNIRAKSGELYNAGFFLSGINPDSSYCFYINRNGTGENGISFPGSSYLFGSLESEKTELKDVNHVTIERIENNITFTLNGTIVAKIRDYFAPLGKGHDRIGFFVKKGAAEFENFKVYRRAIPQVPSPTLVADNFFERGDFDAALDEYSGLLVDLSKSYNINKILIKMADCLLRLNRLDEALGLLDQSFLQQERDEEMISQNYLLRGVILRKLGRERSADSLFKVLSRNYPFSPVNISAMNLSLQQISFLIDNSHEALACKEVASLEEQYKYSKEWGYFSIYLLRHLIDDNMLDSAVVFAKKILSSYPREDDIGLKAKILLGEVYLHQGKKNEGKEIFDQILRANPVANVWDAWNRLASIYEYDFVKSDAAAIFRKIYRVAPRSSPLPLMSGVRAAELLYRDSLDISRKILMDVYTSPNPFPEPRLIAGFYLGEISESQFISQWDLLYPGDRYYLYYLARKANLMDKTEVSLGYLEELKKNMPVHSFRYFKVLKIINNMSRW
jgi:serine/threonine protein kinase/tetratricopeptide (TPR) repeat protein